MRALVAVVNDLTRALFAQRGGISIWIFLVPFFVVIHAVNTVIAGRISSKGGGELFWSFFSRKKSVSIHVGESKEKEVSWCDSRDLSPHKIVLQFRMCQ